MQVMVSAGGKVYSVDEAFLLQFLRQNGSEVVPGGSFGKTRLTWEHDIVASDRNKDNMQLIKD